jgi:gliding motility-associated peptidyl-prolyl isomerase
MVSCSEPTPRYPLNKKNDAFLIQSAKRNKNLYNFEQRLLKNAVQKDSLLSYQNSEAGFFYAIIKQMDSSLPTPKKGEKVRFQYQIDDLEKNSIYDQETLGIVDYSIDQEDLLPGLREGLRIMREGEVVVFLFPSYLCYGYQGDGEKIGINQPLRFTIERLPK